MAKPSRQKMCAINPAIVELMAPMVGGQSDIMLRVGISWNSWLKLQEGLPVRWSLAERLRDRIVTMAADADQFIDAYPHEKGGLDQQALIEDFVDEAPSLLSKPYSLRHHHMQELDHMQELACTE